MSLQEDLFAFWQLSFMFSSKCCPFNSHKLGRIMLGPCLNPPSEVEYVSNGTGVI